MPNIVTNHIEFATKLDCSRAHDLMASEQGDFDFNALKPMPQELNVVASTTGDAAIAQALVLDNDASEENIKETLIAHLPNLPSESLDELTKNIASVLSVASFTHKDAQDCALDGFPSGQRPLSFKAYGQQLLSNLVKYGRKDWYDWSIEHWGVKWNADNVTWLDSEVRFETAWDPVPELIQELAKRLNTHLFYEYAEESFGPEAAGAAAIDPHGDILACASPSEADEWDRLFFEQGSPEWVITFLRAKGLESELDESVDFAFGPYKTFLDSIGSPRARRNHANACSTFELFRDERALYFPGTEDTELAPEELYDAIKREIPHLGMVLNSPTLDLLFEQHALGEQEIKLLCQAVIQASEHGNSRAADIARDDIVLEHIHENVYYALEHNEDGTFTFWCPENDLVKRNMRILDDARAGEAEGCSPFPQLGEPVVIVTSVVWPQIVSTWLPYYDTALDDEERDFLEWKFPYLQIEPIDPTTLPKRANLFRRHRKAYWTEQRTTQLASNTQQPPMDSEQIAIIRNVIENPELNPRSMLLERLLAGPAFNHGEGNALLRNANVLMSGKKLDEIEEKYLITFHREAIYRVMGGDWDLRLITLLDRDADAFVTKRICVKTEKISGFPEPGDLIQIDVAALDSDLITGWRILNGTEERGYISDWEL